MSNAVDDVLLISGDAAFAQQVAARAPARAALRHATVEDIAAEAPGYTARQIWVDLDSAGDLRVPRANRHVYFYSSQPPRAEQFPPGLFIRKPCAPVVFDVLWADVEAPPIASTVRAAAGGTLPRWLLEFHEQRLPALCRRMITGLPPRLGYRHASLYLHDLATSRLELAETTRTEPLERSVPLDATGQSLMAAVAQTGRFFATVHAGAEKAVRGIMPAEVQRYADEVCLIAPLICDSELQGVLNLTGEHAGPLTELGLPIDDIVAFLARALQHARAFDAARTEARVDSLTGLYNLRGLLESLEKEIRRAERFATPLAALVVDLDGLKGVNDRHGHAAGDAVLRHAATCITRVLRQFDGAARVGGDEFVIMLPGTDLKGARHVAARVLETLRKTVAHCGEVDFCVTASIGAAQWHAGWNASQLISSADHAMYHAKHNGRDGLACEPEADAVAPASAVRAVTEPS